MEAICWEDYQSRVKANLAALAAEERRKKLLEEAEKERQRRIKQGRSPGKHAPPEEMSGDESDAEPEIVVPKVGFNDCYGIWFYGQLRQFICDIGRKQFDADLAKMPHAFIDVEPEKIADGIHGLTVYEHECLLYKWTAQGYHRGLVVLKDDQQANMAAEVYQDSQTWSWILSDADQARLPDLLK